jgi:hypothetical protein
MRDKVLITKGIPVADEREYGLNEPLHRLKIPAVSEEMPVGYILGNDGYLLKPQPFANLWKAPIVVAPDENGRHLFGGGNQGLVRRLGQDVIQGVAPQIDNIAVADEKGSLPLHLPKKLDYPFLVLLPRADMKV